MNQIQPSDQSPHFGSATLDSSLECLGMGKYQYFLLLLCGLNFMSDALEVNLLSYLSACTSDTWSLTSSQQASLSGIVFFGITIGSLYWGSFADIYGRRTTFIYSSCLILVGGVITSFVTNFITLLFIRLIVGFGIGGASVPFDLLAEFLPTKERGVYLVFIEFFWTIGSIYVNGLAWAILPSSGDTKDVNINTIFSNQGGWRLLSLLTVLPAFFAFFIGYFYLPESPMWLLSKGRKKEAEEVIIAAANFNGEECWIKLRELGKKVHNLKIESVSYSSPSISVSSSISNNESPSIIFSPLQIASPSSSTPDIHPSETSLPFQLIQQENEHEEHSFKQYLTLILDPELRKISIPLWTVWFLFGLTYYGVILLTGRIYSNDENDDDAGKSCDFDYESMFISSISEVLGVIVCILALDRIGRIRTQMLFYFLAGVGTFFMTCLGVFSYFQNEGSYFILLVSILARMAAMGSSSATWVSTPEVYPTHLRTVGHSISASLSKIGAVLSPYLVISPLPLIVVGIVLGLGNLLAVFSSYFLPETSGMILGDIKKNKEENPNEKTRLIKVNKLNNSSSSSEENSLQNTLININQPEA